MLLFAAFVAVPLIEIALFIQIGGWIGLWPTLAVVVATAALGTWLVRAQGRMAIGQLRDRFERLDDPTEPLAHGAMILVAGALLLTPGFFTDAVGFALLAPPVRTAVFRYIAARVQVQRFEMGAQWEDDHRGPPGSGRGPIIDGDWVEAPEDDRPRPGGKSGWTRH
jgi:UPF0716 protein FxsA